MVGEVRGRRKQKSARKTRLLPTQSASAPAIATIQLSRQIPRSEPENAQQRQHPKWIDQIRQLSGHVIDFFTIHPRCTFKSVAAAMMYGASINHLPPPDGTKNPKIAEYAETSSGNVSWVEARTKNCASMLESGDMEIMPNMPA